MATYSSSITRCNNTTKPKHHTFILMCCSGLLAYPKITKQAISRNKSLPLALVHGIKLRVLTRFNLLTVAEVLPTVQTSQGLSSLGSSHSLSSPDPC